MPEIDKELQQGERVQLENFKKAVPPRQPAMPQQPPQPSIDSNAGAAGQDFTEPPDEEEFISPFAAANLSYEEAKALWAKQIGANLVTDERAHPDMKELYWALKQDLDELTKGEQESGNSQGQQDAPNKNKPEQTPDISSSEVVTLLKEIRDRLGNNKS